MSSEDIAGPEAVRILEECKSGLYIPDMVRVLRRAEFLGRYAHLVLRVAWVRAEPVGDGCEACDWEAGCFAENGLCSVEGFGFYGRVAPGAAVDVAVWFSGQLLKLDDLRWGIFGGMCTLPSTHRGMGLVLSLRWFVEHGAGRRLRFDCRVLWS